MFTTCNGKYYWFCKIDRSCTNNIGLYYTVSTDDDVKTHDGIPKNQLILGDRGILFFFSHLFLLNCNKIIENIFCPPLPPTKKEI